MSDILTGISSIFSSFITMLGTLVTTVVANPLLLLFVIFGLTFAAIGVFKRLTR